MFQKALFQQGLHLLCGPGYDPYSLKIDNGKIGLESVYLEGPQWYWERASQGGLIFFSIISVPNVGLKLTTPRSRVTCSSE